MRTHFSRPLLLVCLVAVVAVPALADPGAIFTTTQDNCGTVNANIYPSKGAVYLNGGPQGNGGPGLPDGFYYVQVTDPSGAVVLGASAPNTIHVTDGSFDQCYQLMAIAPFGDTPNPGGEYKVWVSKDSAFPNSESKTDNFKVACTPPPTPAPAANGPSCIGADPISIQLTAGASADSYSWTGTNGFSSTQENPTDTITAPGSVTYSLTVTVNGCTSAAGSTTIVVNATPATPAPTNDGPHCFTANPTAVQLHANATADSYSWTGPNGFTSSASDPTDSLTAPGSYTYSLTVTTNGCPSDAGSTTVVINPLPGVSVSASGPTTFCLGGSVTLTASPSGTGPFSYSWSNGATSQSITVGAAGAYSVTVTDANGCSKSSAATTVITLQCACALTQGAYGSAGGAGTVSQVSSLIGSLLTAGVSPKSFSVASGDAACLVLRLPAGGTPAMLPSGPSVFTSGYSSCNVTVSSMLKNGKFNNVLFGQTITLTLNVRGNANLAGVHLCPSMTTQHVIGVYLDPNSVPTTFAIPSSVLTALGPNATVGGLLNMANQALGGAAGLPPLSDINAAVNNINVGFDGCRALIACN